MSDPFATAQDFAQFMGVPLPDDLARMQSHLELSSAVIRRFCGQTLSTVALDVVVLEPIERDTLVLPERPVTAVSGVVVLSVPNTNFRFTRAGLVIEKSGLFWSDGATVTYDHGYAEETEEYKAIKAICLESASRAFTLNERSASEALGDTVMESAGFSPEVFLTPGEKMLLADFGKVAVG